MTVTYSIEHVPTSVEDVSIEVAPKSEMTWVATYTDPNTGELVTDYRLASGEDLYPARISYRVGTQTRKGKSVRRISMTYYTWAKRSDSVTGVDTREECSASVQFFLPAGMTIELADLDDFLGVAFSAMYASVTTKVRDTGYLQKLLYGVSAVVAP